MKVSELRRRRGLSAAQIAKLAGVTRQTIYAIEAGSYMPNTAVALRLARALDTTVEELFSLAEDVPPAEVQVSFLAGSAGVHAGQPVQLCRVDKQLVAFAPSPLQWCFPPADAVVTGGKSKVQPLRPEPDAATRLLMAGCDPGMSVLARHAQSAGIELVLAHRNSSQALRLLKDGRIHVAGTHLRDDSSGESNLPEIHRLFPKRSVAVISFAVWEEGIVIASGNPKSIKGVDDFARSDVTIVNREKGAGSRMLLDSRLKTLRIHPSKVRGYDRTAPGHLAAAAQVHSAQADACIATRAAARLFGLTFIPLVSERYDLVLRRRSLPLPAIQTLLDTLARSTFRHELQTLGGYDTTTTGRRLL